MSERSWDGMENYDELDTMPRGRTPIIAKSPKALLAGIIYFILSSISRGIFKISVFLRVTRKTL